MPPLSRPRLAAAVILIGAVSAALVGGFAWAAGWIGAPRITSNDAITALEYNGGRYPGYRRAHAKGMCFTGWFDANGAGGALSMASVFRPGRYPVIGRFSVAGANPMAGDGRNVFHAMALLLRTPDGQQWRMAMDHTPFFPVSDVPAFLAFQYASRPVPATGVPNPAAMKSYLAEHPETKRFLDYMASAPLPDSFAKAIYYSINAFRFTNAQGVTRSVRWQMEPEIPLTALDKSRLADLPRDALFREMIDRTARGPSHWHMLLVVANPGDRTDNATIAWTGTHQRTDAGTLTLERVMPEETGACRDLNFDPTIVPRGIALSDDPLLGARAKVYSTSFTHRATEGPHPSAVGEDLHVEESR